MKPATKKKSTKPPNDTLRLMEEKLHDFEALNSALSRILSTMQVEETLKHIIVSAIKLCQADQGSILIIRAGQVQEGETLIREGGSKVEKLDEYMNRLLAGWCFVHKEPLLTNDLGKTFSKENILDKYQDICSAISIPLKLDEEIIGVVNLISQNKNHLFSARELRIMEQLSSTCAQFIQNAQKHEALLEETHNLKKAVSEKYAYEGIIGQSPVMKKVFSILDRIIPTDVRVLVNGESGTGKERIARVIHYNGSRKDAPFVAVDCGALPANLLESELFGYVKGAFTGADKNRNGLFQEADGGTLFLDEIVNMPFEVQSKLLRAIQENEIRPLGSSQTIKIDVRIISAASSNLPEQIQAGKFRQDLFFRLNVVNVDLPPLRKRSEDIPVLARHFLSLMNQRYQKQIKGFQDGTLLTFGSYSWPGNIREMEHAIEQAVVLCTTKYLNKKDFALLQNLTAVSDQLFEPRPLKEALDDFKKRYIHGLLKQTGGNQSKTARILKIQRTYLNRLLKELSS